MKQRPAAGESRTPIVNRRNTAGGGDQRSDPGESVRRYQSCRDKRAEALPNMVFALSTGRNEVAEERRAAGGEHGEHVMCYLGQVTFAFSCFALLASQLLPRVAVFAEEQRYRGGSRESRRVL